MSADPNRERLLAAASARQKLDLAAELLRRASFDLAEIKHDVALESAKKAIRAAEIAGALVGDLIERIP